MIGRDGKGHDSNYMAVTNSHIVRCEKIVRTGRSNLQNKYIEVGGRDRLSSFSGPYPSRSRGFESRINS